MRSRIIIILFILFLVIIITFKFVSYPVTAQDNSSPNLQNSNLIDSFATYFKNAVLEINKPKLAKRDYKKGEKIELDVKRYNSRKQKISVKTVKGEDADFETVISDSRITFKPNQETQPGVYKITLTENEKVIYEEKFSWGVLAVNSDKSIYLPKETVHFSFAVLDDEGQMVCDANLKLIIKNSNQNIYEELSTDNGKILVSPDCLLHDFTLNPDYSTQYLAEETGVYNLELTSTTTNGTYSTTDSFEVKESIPFDVKRVTATRIYPPHIYPVSIEIKFQENFEGIIKESVPIGFQISKTQKNLNYDNLIIKDDRQIISWQIKAKPGDKLILDYAYLAPKTSPQFYLLGPLQFAKQEKEIENLDFDKASTTSPQDLFITQKNDQGEIIAIIPNPDKEVDDYIQNNKIITKEMIVFEELRQWQIAADAPVNKGFVSYQLSSQTNIPKIMTWDNANWSVPANGNSVGGTIRWIVTKANPQRDEIVIGTLDSNNDIKVQFCTYAGSCGSPVLMTDSASVSTTRVFDVEIEKNSGDVVVVYQRGVAQQISYNVWNGTTWIGQQNLTIGTASTQNSYWLDLFSAYDSTSPNPDNMMLAVETAVTSTYPDLYASPWTGSSNSFGAVQTISTTLEPVSSQGFYGSYEDISGEFLLFYSKQDVGILQYTRYNGNWSTGTGRTSSSADIHNFRSVVYPDTDRIMTCWVAATAADVDCQEWNGANLSVGVSIDASIETISHPTRAIDVAPVLGTGGFIVIYGDANIDYFKFAQCTSQANCQAGTWAIRTPDTTDIGTDTRWGQIYADPNGAGHLIWIGTDQTASNGWYKGRITCDSSGCSRNEAANSLGATTSLLYESAMFDFITYAPSTSINISGNAYQDDENNVWNYCSSGVSNISLSIDGDVKQSVECDPDNNGYFVFNNVSLNSANQLIAVYFDSNGGDKSVIYTKNLDTSSNIGGLTLVKDRVTIQSESVSSITGDDIAIYDKTSDGDIPIDFLSTNSTVTYDTGSSAFTSNSYSDLLSWTHNTANQPNRILIVGVALRNNTAIDKITYGPNNRTLTKIRSDTVINGSNSDARSELWYLINPEPGNNNITVSSNVSARFAAGASTWYGVDQLTPIGNDSGSNSGAASSTSIGTTIISSVGEIVVDHIASQSQNTSLAPNASQTLGWKSVNTNTVSASSRKAGASNVTMTWTSSLSDYFAHSLVGIKPLQNKIEIDQGIDLHINTGDTFIPDNTLVLGGSYYNNGNVNWQENTVIFNSLFQSEVLAGNLNGTSSFYRMIFNGSSGGWNIQNPTDVSSNSLSALSILQGSVILGQKNGDNLILNGGMLVGSGDGMASFSTLDNLASGSQIIIDINNNSSPVNCPNCIIQVGTGNESHPSANFTLNKNSIIRLNSFSMAQSGIKVYDSGKLSVQGTQDDTGTDSGVINSSFRESKICANKAWTTSQHNGKHVRMTSGLAFGQIYSITATTVNDSNCLNNYSSLTKNDNSSSIDTNPSIQGNTYCSGPGACVINVADNLITENNQHIGKYLHNLTDDKYYLIIDTAENDQDSISIVSNEPDNFDTINNDDDIEITDGVRIGDNFEIIDYANISSAAGINCNAANNGYINIYNQSELDINYGEICDLGSDIPFYYGAINGNKYIYGLGENEKLSIRNSYIHHSFRGISWEAGTIQSGLIENNLISDIDYWGISINNLARLELSKVFNNRITNCGNDGILFSGDLSNANLIYDNYIYSNNQSGIEIWSGFSNNLIKNNFIYGNKNDGGIYFNESAGKLLITENKIFSNSVGINQLSGNKTYFSENEIFANDIGHVMKDITSNYGIGNRYGVKAANTEMDVFFKDNSVATSFSCFGCFGGDSFNVGGTMISGTNFSSFKHNNESGLSRIWGQYSIPSDNIGTPQNESINKFNFSENTYPNQFSTYLFGGEGFVDSDLSFSLNEGVLSGDENYYVYRVVCNTEECYDGQENDWDVYRNEVLIGQATSNIQFTDITTNVQFIIGDEMFFFGSYGDTYIFYVWKNSGDINTQKRLYLMRNGDSFTVPNAGSLELKGQSSGLNETTITRGSTGGYHFNINGTVDAQYYKFSYLGGDNGDAGLNLGSGSTIVNLSYGTYDNFQNVGTTDTYIKVNSSLIEDGNPTKSFSDIKFYATTGVPEYSITESGGTPGSGYWFFPNTTCNSWSSCENSDSDTGSGEGTIRYTDAAPTPENLTSTSNQATAYSFQRKTFYDDTNNNYWVFYSDGSQIVGKYSNNETDWYPSFSSTITPNSNFNDFSLWYVPEYDYVYIAYYDNYDITVRRGTLSTNSVTWGNPYVVFDGSGSTSYYSYPFISLDSSYYILLTARQHTNTGTPYYHLKLAKSSLANDPSGSWTVTTLTSNNASPNVYGSVLPLDSQKLLATWMAGISLYSKKYDGSNWDMFGVGLDMGMTGVDFGFEAAVDSNYNVHLVYLNSSNYPIYRNYAYPTWQAPITLLTTEGNRFPTISVSSSGDNSVYVFWKNYNSIDLKRSCYPYTSWTAGQISNYVPNLTSFTSTYKDFGSGKLFLMWTTGTSSPYQITWESIDPVSCSANQPPNEPTILTQSKTDDTDISTGDWTNSSSIKFTAQASDPDLSDQLQLCIEVKPVGTIFSNTEDSCGTAISNSSAGVTVTHTINNISNNQHYHWQARVKDTSNNYSDWVAYGNNLETENDFSIDTTPPTGGSVYDGLETEVDKDFNDGSLSVLSANWGDVDSSLSGLSYYEYSIGTSAGESDIKNWTNNGVGTSVTVNSLSLQTSFAYYFNVRAVDNAGNTQTPIFSDGQLVAPSLSFGISPSSVTFDNLNSSNNFSVGETTTLTVSTNAYGGYFIRAYITDNLKSISNPSITIPNYDGGTYSSPDGWSQDDIGFGYNSSDILIQGFNHFNSNPCPGGNLPPCYAPFSQFYPGDIVADHASGITGTPVTNEQFTIDYRIKTSASQLSSVYSTTVVYLVTAQF